MSPARPVDFLLAGCGRRLLPARHRFDREQVAESDPIDPPRPPRGRSRATCVAILQYRRSLGRRNLAQSPVNPWFSVMDAREERAPSSRISALELASETLNAA